MESFSIPDQFSPKMPRGTLEVLLVSAKGLENIDFLSKMDPYVILTCRSQEQRSSVLSGQGSEPKWNENFVFTINDDAPELNLKIMDNDPFTKDDFVGEATIPLEPLFVQGSLPSTAYSVVKNQEYCGEIRVGLTFTIEGGSSRECCTEEVNYGGWEESSIYIEEESYGGWKESSIEEESYGGWKESSIEEESYGGWKESSY